MAQSEPAVVSFNDDGRYKEVVLVLDQRKGDQSILAAGASESNFKRMLNDAINENPSALILVKTHLDAISGGFQGYYSSYSPEADNIRILRENINPISLLNAIDKVYAVSSQMGMEALMCGKEVFCYASPIYSGWGLTTDRGHPRKRDKERSLLEIFFVMYVKHMHYYDPIKGARGSIMDALRYLQSEIS